MKTLAALAVAGFLTLFSCAPQKVETPTQQTQDANAWARKLRPTFHRIGLESLADNIERGGVGVLEDGEIVIYEIDNYIRADEKRFAKYAEGDDTLYGILNSNVGIAASTASGCVPEFTHGFYAQASVIQNKLVEMLCLTGEKREIVGKFTWVLYDDFVRHHMYVKDPSEYEKIKEKHTIVFHFHTHPNGTSGSLVDRRLSHERDEVVISVINDQYQLFYLKDGKEELIDSYDPSLARKD